MSGAPRFSLDNLPPDTDLDDYLPPPPPPPTIASTAPAYDPSHATPGSGFAPSPPSPKYSLPPKPAASASAAPSSQNSGLASPSSSSSSTPPSPLYCALEVETGYPTGYVPPRQDDGSSSSANPPTRRRSRVSPPTADTMTASRRRYSAYKGLTSHAGVVSADKTVKGKITDLNIAIREELRQIQQTIPPKVRDRLSRKGCSSTNPPSVFSPAHTSNSSSSSSSSSSSRASASSPTSRGGGLDVSLTASASASSGDVNASPTFDRASSMLSALSAAVIPYIPAPSNVKRGKNAADDSVEGKEMSDLEKGAESKHALGNNNAETEDDDDDVVELDPNAEDAHELDPGVLQSRATTQQLLASLTKTRLRTIAYHRAVCDVDVFLTTRTTQFPILRADRTVFAAIFGHKLAIGLLNSNSSLTKAMIAGAFGLFTFSIVMCFLINFGVVPKSVSYAVGVAFIAVWLQLISLLNIDLAKQILRTFLYWFYVLQVALLFFVVWPDICSWDERSFMIITWGLCACTSIMTDAMPTQNLHKLMSSGISSALLTVIFLTICIYREWFVDLRFRMVSIASTEFNTKEQFLSRIITLGLFALKFIKTTLVSPDALLLISATVTRSDFINKYQSDQHQQDDLAVIKDEEETAAMESWPKRTWRKIVACLGD